MWRMRAAELVLCEHRLWRNLAVLHSNINDFTPHDFVLRIQNSIHLKPIFPKRYLLAVYC